jgi:hypothetical protein
MRSVMRGFPMKRPRPPYLRIMSRIGADAFEHFRRAALRSVSRFSINSSACWGVGRPSCEAGRYPLCELALSDQYAGNEMSFTPTTAQ